MNAEDRHDIMEVKVYVDSKGHEVRSFSQVFGKEKGPTFYHGIAIMRMQGQAPTGQVVVQDKPLEFPFPDGTTLKTAFGGFDEVANAAVQDFARKQKEQQAASRLVRAGFLPRSLLGPDGKPVPMKGG